MRENFNPFIKSSCTRTVPSTGIESMGCRPTLCWQRFLLIIYKVHLDKRVPYRLPGLIRNIVLSGQENSFPSTGIGKKLANPDTDGNSIKPPGR
jgi:hypothetical protein